jgi:hypothetical protein
MTGLQTTYGPNPAEEITHDYVGYIIAGLFGNSIVANVSTLRHNVFSEARFLWQGFQNGRPAELFWTPELASLEEPWTGGTTGDLLSRAILDADFAGNSYTVRPEEEFIRLRPDWCKLVLAPREMRRGKGGTMVDVGWKIVGLLYYQAGEGSGSKPAVFVAGEFAHFAPNPDPLATYRGRSWLTPVIRELQIDMQATKHKGKFFENAATPNLAVSLKTHDPEVFDEFVERMELDHKGVGNAYKTLYTAAGADVTVIGSNLQEMDLSATQGSGETRIVNAAGIHPVVAAVQEGLAGSALNSGNYKVARDSTVDRTFRPLWRNFAGSITRLLRNKPVSSRLWYDARDIAFLRDDAAVVAEIQAKEATTFRTLLDAGYTADSVTQAILANDWSRLKHSGLFSVQLQAPGVNPAPVK